MAPPLDAEGRRALGAAPAQPPCEGGRWTRAKVAAWIARRTGREAVPAQRGWVHLRRTGHNPQDERVRVHRPRHARAAADAVAARAAFQNS